MKKPGQSLRYIACSVRWSSQSAISIIENGAVVRIIVWKRTRKRICLKRTAHEHWYLELFTEIWSPPRSTADESLGRWLNLVANGVKMIGHCGSFTTAVTDLNFRRRLGFRLPAAGSQDFDIARTRIFSGQLLSSVCEPPCPFYLLSQSIRTLRLNENSRVSIGTLSEPSFVRMWAQWAHGSIRHRIPPTDVHCYASQLCMCTGTMTTSTLSFEFVLFIGKIYSFNVVNQSHNYIGVVCAKVNECHTHKGRIQVL